MYSIHERIELPPPHGIKAFLIKPEESQMTDAATPTAGELFLLEAFDPANRADPYPLYARMRADAPVLNAGNNLWFTFTHGGANGLLRARGTSSNERNSNFFKQNVAEDQILQEFADREPIMLFMDPPDHTRLRSLVSSAFTPRTVESLVPRIQAITDALLDDIAERAADGEPIDLVDSLAYPLPLTIICEMLGVPTEDEAIFSAWSSTLAAGLDPGPVQTEEEQRQMLKANEELEAYTRDLLARRATDPGDDLLSALLSVRDGEDQLSEMELVNMVVLLLVAGHETTVNLIGNGVIALLRDRPQLEAWQADPEFDKNAVDELLRYDSPVQFGMRVLMADTDVEGQMIPAGDQVLTVLGAANRDPEVFVDPDRLDLTRSNAARNMSFGGGIHHCLGMALARVEGQRAIGTLIRRFPDLELAGEPELRARLVLRGYEKIPITV